jgi:hypothetical protein
MSAYVIKEDLQNKTVSIYTEETSKAVATWKYTLPRLRLKILVGYKGVTIAQTFPFLYRWRRQLMLRSRLLKFQEKVNLTPEDLTTAERIISVLAYKPARACYRFLKKMKVQSQNAGE